MHGGQLPCVRAAADCETELQELRTRALSIADRALDVVEDALEHDEPQVDSGPGDDSAGPPRRENPRVCTEPPVGIEPTTFSLRVRCSTD